MSAKRELEEETQIMKGYTLSALTAKNNPIVSPLIRLYLFVI